MQKTYGSQDAAKWYSVSDRSKSKSGETFLNEWSGSPSQSGKYTLRKSNLFSELDVPLYANTDSAQHKALVDAINKRR